MKTNTATKRQVLQIWLPALLLYRLIRVSSAPIACSDLDLDRYSFFRMAPGRLFFINVHMKFEYGCDRYKSITAP